MASQGNLHKWLYGPKGTAMLWAAPQFQKDGTIVPPVLSSESGGENFAGDFEYTGTRDYTGYCALPAAFRFRDSLPGDGKAAREYGHHLAVCEQPRHRRHLGCILLKTAAVSLRTGGGHHLAEQYGTSVMSPASMTAWITNIELPMRDAEQMASSIFADFSAAICLKTVGRLRAGADQESAPG